MHCPEKNCTSKYIASFTNIHKAVTDVFTFGNPDGTVRKYKRLYLCVSDLLTISTFCPCEGRPNPPEGLALFCPGGKLLLSPAPALAHGGTDFGQPRHGKECSPMVEPCFVYPQTNVEM